MELGEETRADKQKRQKKRYA